MEAQHTQRQWLLARDERCDNYTVQIQDGNFVKEIAIIPTGFDEPWESLQHAHARLIHGAPKMFEALTWIEEKARAAYLNEGRLWYLALADKAAAAQKAAQGLE